MASFVYELPFGAGKSLASQGVIGKIVGGWQVGGIVTFSDGAPLNGTQLGDTANLGNLGRNTLSRPGTRNMDASLARNIRLYESHTLNLRFEAFNASNHPNWNAPSTDPRSPTTFGVMTSAKTMRQLQFAVKYTF